MRLCPSWLLVVAGCTSGNAVLEDGKTSTDPTTAGTDSDADTDTPTDSCTVTIPADAQVINADASSTDDGVVAYVCAHSTFSASGTGGRYFVESRGQLLLSGTGGTAWAPTGTRLTLIGGSNRVFAEDGADIQDDGKGNTVIDCPVVTFDPASLPSGC